MKIELDKKEVNYLSFVMNIFAKGVKGSGRFKADELTPGFLLCHKLALKSDGSQRVHLEHIAENFLMAAVASDAGLQLLESRGENVREILLKMDKGEADAST